MENNRIFQFIKDGLESHGAIVEQIGEDLLEGLLPPLIAQKMGFREDQLFSTNSVYQHDKEVEYISYNSEVLERFSYIIEDTGLFSAMKGPPDLYLKQRGLEKLASERVSFLNATQRFLQREETQASYLLFNFKYTAISEEKQDGIIAVIINEHTLASPLPSQMLGEKFSEGVNLISSMDQIPTGLPEPQEVDIVFQRACDVARKRIGKSMADFEKSLYRRMRRDIERLTEYYQTIIQQIQKKIEKKQLSKEEREKEEARIQATKLELKRKAIDQKKRYSLKVEVDLINTQRIVIPVISMAYEVKRKQNMRRITLTWNPLTKDIERPLCESCFEEAEGFHLCDKHLHLLCPHCNTKCPACQKYFCQVCHPRACPRCCKSSSHSS